MEAIMWTVITKFTLEGLGWFLLKQSCCILKTLLHSTFFLKILCLLQIFITLLWWTIYQLPKFNLITLWVKFALHNKVLECFTTTKIASRETYVKRTLSNFFVWNDIFKVWLALGSFYWASKQFAEVFISEN